jgi:hypothetical protein
MQRIVTISLEERGYGDRESMRAGFPWGMGDRSLARAAGIGMS